MLFNTPEFILFFLSIIVLTYVLNYYQCHTIRNVILLVASYCFYGNFHLYYPLLLVYVTLVNYSAGYLIQREDTGPGKRQLYTGFAIVLSLLPLATLKYAPNYTDSLWLPVGLSFFTFQSLTYTIDLYRNKIREKFSLLDVSLFIAFFPTLLSGPIERARNLIPQLRANFDMNKDNTIAGAQLFVWGLFKKIVIADRLSEWVNTIYASADDATGGTLAVAAVLYSFQIYYDFSGYASMAIGCGRMLGIKLMENFNFPYFAASVKDFWRRWHISLTSWFTEYVYISLGGNRVSRLRWILNISAVFLLSGIWHGATWAFVIWGAIHGLLYLLEHYLGLKDKWGIYRVFVFIGVTLAWIFFRVEDSAMAAAIIAKIFSGPWYPIQHGAKLIPIAACTICLLLCTLAAELCLYLNKMPKNWLVRAIGFSVLIVAISLFAVSSNQFVYFKF